MCSDISSLNANFWTEPCGSQLAAVLGLAGKQDAQALADFDTNYFKLYPYLTSFFDDLSFEKSKILEIGLGMGTLSEWLAIRSFSYRGLDIAAGPVDIVNLRLSRLGMQQSAVQGSILFAPFESNSFDCIVAIGCLHHTGDLKKSIGECFRMLRPGGRLKLMVYYSYSARRWLNNPLQTALYLMNELTGVRTVVDDVSQSSRASYDTNSAGAAAPYTDFISRKSLRQTCKAFSSSSFMVRNFEREGPWSLFPRSFWLRTPIPSFLGLDLYATLVK